MERERNDSLEELLKRKVDVKDYIDPDLKQDEMEQHKLHLLHQERHHRQRKRHAAKGKPWRWNRIRSRPNTKHGYH